MLPPMGTDVGELVLVTAMSATGFTVVVTEAELLAGLGSGSVALTLAVLVMEGAAAACGVTTIVAVALFNAMLGRAPTLHVTMPAACEQEPWLALAETKVTPAGRVSVMVTLVAPPGPLLVAVNVYVRLLPTLTGLGAPDLLSERSVAWPTTLTVAVAESLAGLVSLPVLVMLAVLESEPTAVGVTTSEMVELLLLARLARLQMKLPVVPTNGVLHPQPGAEIETKLEGLIASDRASPVAVSDRELETFIV